MLRALEEDFWGIAYNERDRSHLWHWWGPGSDPHRLHAPGPMQRRRRPPLSPNVCRDCVDACEVYHAPPLGPDVFVTSLDARYYHVTPSCDYLVRATTSPQPVPMRLALARGMQQCAVEGVGVDA